MCRQARETYILSKRTTEEGEDPPTPPTHGAGDNCDCFIGLGL